MTLLIDEALFDSCKPTVRAAANRANQRLREGQLIASDYADIRQGLSSGVDEIMDRFSDSLGKEKAWTLRTEGFATYMSLVSMNKNRRVLEKTKLLSPEQRQAGLQMVEAFIGVKNSLDHLKTLVRKRTVLTSEQKLEKRASEIRPTSPFEQRIYEAVMALRPSIEAKLKEYYIDSFAAMMTACERVGLPWQYLLSAKTGYDQNYRKTDFPVWPGGRRPGESAEQAEERRYAQSFHRTVSEPLPQEAARVWFRFAPSLERYLSISTDGLLDEKKLAKLVAEKSLTVCLNIVAKLRHKVAILESPSMRPGSDWGSFTLTGELHQKRIVIDQSTKFSTSVRGLPFVQFPALIYVDGKMMPEARFLVWSGAAKQKKDEVEL